MLQDIQNSKPAVLIMWKTDRLARDDDVFYTSKAALREAGVRREYVADINTDDTPAGHFVDHMLEGFATFFSEQLSENIKRGESFNADRAIANGYRILGYKYDDWFFVIHSVLSPFRCPVRCCISCHLLIRIKKKSVNFAMDAAVENGLHDLMHQLFFCGEFLCGVAFIHRSNIPG